MSPLTIFSQILDLLPYSMLLWTILLWPGFTGCCRKEKRPVINSAEQKTANEATKASKVEGNSTESLEKSSNKVSKQVTVPGIVSSPNAKSGEGTRNNPIVMPTQLSSLPYESITSQNNKDSTEFNGNSSSRKATKDGRSREEDATEETQVATELDNQVDLNDFILKAAENQIVVHPSLVKKKGNIDASMFRSRTKEEIMELEAAMKSDHESELEKDIQKEMSKQKPKIKWGDSKCVVFETSTQLTYDDDEVIEEPDLYE
ncbi:hypothetical protein RB195_008311 [Necator americanus]|uniref:Uncharacterized protein n=1 Tax=Necator americanus TaxID=51031 RepID=A0ABR1CN17_NECAM